MLKKIISIALAVVMVLSVAAISASAAVVSDSSVGAEVSNSAGADTDSAATGADNVIYFDTTGWKNFQTVYCHIWERGGEAFFSWQAKAEQCQPVSGKSGIYSYDLSKLNDSTQVEGGLKDGTDYCVIFSNNIGVQTFDQTFGKPCIGDTAKVTGKMIENAVDSEKSAYESVWTANSKNYGPHLAISSIGNIIGSVLCPNESGNAVIGDWLPNYFSSPNVDATATLAKAFPKFGVDTADDIQAIYTYILAKGNSDLIDDDYAEMEKILTAAFAKAYPAKEEVKVDKNAAKEKAEKVKTGQEDINAVAGADSASSGNSNSGSTGSTGSSSGSNRSGAGSDGQEDTILFILGGVMLAAAGVMFVSRKRKED